ncbi:MAG: zf-HC2 domain-containing protein [Nitrosomonas sp. PRO4]|nr:zf-HC2 domain-containing protein [Nitrosomonas sp.]MCB1977036.1 zf-HC2 domain-containing protein [Nitrosomonas sp.]MCE7913925.1 zf-HC2 domain-containing protein [Nitrosomonas sp. PRO4]
MLNCKQASQLASRLMDEELPFWEKFSLKMHLFLCRSCSNFSRQLDFLRKVSRHDENMPDFQLTDEAKQRIANALIDKQRSN